MPPKGCKHSEETKKKMSLTQKGKEKPEKEKERLRSLRNGVVAGPCSEETKKKIGAANSVVGIPRLMKNGYMRVVVSTYPTYSRMYEHRWKMEQFLGRKLGKDEDVHHINGIRTDNRIENLEVVKKSDHAKEHVTERIKNGGHNGRFCKI